MQTIINVNYCIMSVVKTALAKYNLIGEWFDAVCYSIIIGRIHVLQAECGYGSDDEQRHQKETNNDFEFKTLSEYREWACMRIFTEADKPASERDHNLARQELFLKYLYPRMNDIMVTALNDGQETSLTRLYQRLDAVGTEVMP